MASEAMAGLKAFSFHPGSGRTHNPAERRRGFSVPLRDKLSVWRLTIMYRRCI
jgi:hypothetical protein